MGAIETLICWENLETSRYLLKNHTTGGELNDRFLCVYIDDFCYFRGENIAFESGCRKR